MARRLRLTLGQKSPPLTSWALHRLFYIQRDYN
jgi:hypothetical protein